MTQTLSFRRMASARQRSASYFSGVTLSVASLGVTYLSEARLLMRRAHPLHSHPALHQVIWVLAGAMGMRSDTHRHVCHAGEGCVLPADLTHAVYCPPRVEVDRVTIIDLRLKAAGARSSEMSKFVSTRRAMQPFRGDVARWSALASDLRAVALEKESAQRTARVASLVWGLLVDTVADSTRPADDTPTVDGRLRRAEAFMVENLDDPRLDVSTISAAVGLSRSQLTRLFMQHHNTGPSSRLRQLRVDRARAMLTTSGLSAKEIARHCGFGHTGQMTRVFRTLTGATPTTHRDASVV